LQFIAFEEPARARFIRVHAGLSCRHDCEIFKLHGLINREARGMAASDHIGAVLETIRRP
jgi:hypothetical protein